MEVQIEIYGLTLRPDVLNGAKKGILGIMSETRLTDLLCLLTIEEGANLVVMVNDQRQSPDYILKETDLVKVILPISGG